MTLSKTSKILIAIVILIMIAVAVWFFFFSKKEIANQPNPTDFPVATTTPKTEQEEFSQKAKNIVPSVAPENVPMAVVAKRFASRLGSFSLNKRDADPMFDLLPLVTPKAKTLAEEYYNQLGQKPEPFYGISSKTVSFKVISSNDNEAVAELILIQSEQDSLGIQTASYQSNLKLELLKVNDAWLVDNFIWS